jgi:glutamate synthase (NADPH/NADH) large chain/glutamate synthase (ferredoxin)
MMRKCHLNTCPVGVATQDPELRKQFKGKPEHVVNYFFFVAEEIRELMAQLGFRTMADMIGRTDKIRATKAVDHWKAKGLDLSPLLHMPDVSPDVATHCVQAQDHGIADSVDWELLKRAQPALDDKTPVEISISIRNTQRTIGTILSSHVAKRYGAKGLPDDTIRIRCQGSAGQSFGAFLSRGITMSIEGESNDYLGKGLSGGRIIVVPPKGVTFVPEETILIGNTALYGATAGEGYFYGTAGERFAVRNSGAIAVIEGTGDHACEYMTGGRVVVLGPTGRNFAAGMSGGIAYVFDGDGRFQQRCNLELVELEQVVSDEDQEELLAMVTQHLTFTGSSKAKRLLEQWDQLRPKFVKVMPTDYKRVLEERKRQASLADSKVSVHG